MNNRYNHISFVSFFIARELWNTHFLQERVLNYDMFYSYIDYDMLRKYREIKREVKIKINSGGYDNNWRSIDWRNEKGNNLIISRNIATLKQLQITCKTDSLFDSYVDSYLY